MPSDALVGTWEPYYPFPRPGDPGIFRVGCSCGKWEATGTAEDVGGDLQRRAAVRSTFEESVRSGRALGNAALARLMYGLAEGAQPEPGQLRAASARASEWRRAVAGVEHTEAAQ